MRWIKLWVVGLMLWGLPSMAFSVEQLDWKTHGLVALSIAVLVSIGLIWRNKELNSVTARIMAFGVYFWVLVFFQAILYGLYYGFVR